MTARLNDFLMSIERRAFRMVRFAAANDEDALDVVQEAMTRLISHYRDREEAEWRPLFFRILQHCLADSLRQQQKQRRWMFWSGSQADVPETGSADGMDDYVGDYRDEPDQALASSRQQQALISAIATLPLQQQQCFLLRCWEGLSVRETADALNISEGSVKTHLSRARQKLNEVAEYHDTEICG